MDILESFCLQYKLKKRSGGGIIKKLPESERGKQLTVLRMTDVNNVWEPYNTPRLHATPTEELATYSIGWSPSPSTSASPSHEEDCFKAHWAMSEGSGFILYDSIGNKDAVAAFINNSNWIAGPTESDKAILFNGVNQCATVGNSAASSYSSSVFMGNRQFLYDFWFKTSSKNEGTMLSSGRSGEFVFSYWLIGASSDGKITFSFSCGVGSLCTMTSSLGGYNDNNWHHLQALRTGFRTGALCIDDNLVAEDTDDTGSFNSVDTGALISIARKWNGTTYFMGALSNIKFYRGCATWPDNFDSVSPPS